MIGRYAIGSLLGAGGMGEVYRAHDQQLDRDVAIKVLPAAFSADADAVHRLEQEARATAALNHPGVLAIYDAGVHDGRSYLVTELLDGMTLRERLNRERVSVEAAVKYATQVAQALAVAHARGIVHRDIKPENLFITTGDSVKILDFGLAKVSLSSNTGQTLADMTFAGTLPNMVMGTLGYMAPEQARGQPVDHRVDIFALGCVIFEMLAGRGPFVRDTAADAITAILKEPPPAIADEPARTIPPALRLIASRVWRRTRPPVSSRRAISRSRSAASRSEPRRPRLESLLAPAVTAPPRRSKWLDRRRARCARADRRCRRMDRRTKPAAGAAGADRVPDPAPSRHDLRGQSARRPRPDGAGGRRVARRSNDRVRRDRRDRHEAPMDPVARQRRAPRRRRHRRRLVLAVLVSRQPLPCLRRQRRAVEARHRRQDDRTAWQSSRPGLRSCRSSPARGTTM